MVVRSFFHLSLCPSHQWTAAPTPGQFAAECWRLQRGAHSCSGQHLVESQQKRLNTDLFKNNWLKWLVFYAVIWRFLVSGMSAIDFISLCASELPSVLWHCWLGIRKSIQPVKMSVRCWCGYLSGARCRLFAYGPADATAITKPHHLLPHLNSDCFCLSGTSLRRLLWKTGR